MQQPWGENPCGFALMDLLLKYALSHCSTKHRLSFRPLVLLGHRRIPAISALPAPCHFNHSYTSDQIPECDCSFCPLYHTLPGSWCTSTIYFRKTVFPCMHSLSCFLHLIPFALGISSQKKNRQYDSFSAMAESQGFEPWYGYKP